MNQPLISTTGPQDSPVRGFRRWRPIAAATALATAAAFSLFEGSIFERQKAHAAAEVCVEPSSGPKNGEFEYVGNSVQSCTTTKAGVFKVIARGSGGGPGDTEPYTGGAGAVVTTYQLLPKGTVLQLSVGATSHDSGGGGSATAVTGSGVVVVAGGGGGSGTLSNGGVGAANKTAAGGDAGNGGSANGQGGQANGRGGNGGKAIGNPGPADNGQGGTAGSAGKPGSQGTGGGGGGAKGGNGGSLQELPNTAGGLAASFNEAARSAGGGGAGFAGGGAGAGAGGGGYGGGGGGATNGNQTTGGGAGGSHASSQRAAYGFATTYRPGGAHENPRNDAQRNGSVSITFIQANEKPRPQTVAGSCKSKIPVKTIKRHAKKTRNTTILPAKCKTVAGTKVKVSAKWYVGKKNVTKKKAGKWLKRKSYKNGKVILIAKSVPKKTKVVLTYTAPRNAKYTAYKAVKTVRIRK